MPKNSENQPQEQSKTKKTFYQAYGLPYICTNFSLLVGHPAERLKVAVQIDLKKPQREILKPILTDSFPNLFRGFVTCALRQNTKYVHRTLIMTTMPQWVDGYNFNSFFSSLLKGFIASSIDTFIAGPFENVKTRQMKVSHKTPMFEAVSSIYRENGFRGFFFGTNVTIAKSFPSWAYLFLGYHAIKDQRQKQSFLSTVFWATTMSLPLTIFTTPADVIKSQRQAGLVPKGESSFKLSNQLVSNFGLTCLWRGFPFRLLHKALATTAGYLIMDIVASNI